MRRGDRAVSDSLASVLKGEIVGTPADADGITALWLTDTLRIAGVIDRGRVVSVEHRPVGQSGMAGQIRQLRIGYDERPPGAPDRLVAKFSAGGEARAITHSMGFYEREVGFYRNFAADAPVSTPTCYFSDVDPESGASLLLLEDLTWMRHPDAVDGTVSDVEIVLAELAKLHAAWWEDARLEATPWLPLRGMMSAEQVSPTFTQAWPSFLRKLSVPVTAEIVEAGELGARYLLPVFVSMHSDPPRTLIHNDVQGDNLLITADRAQPPVFIDWQLATGAHGVVDVADLVGGHLDTNTRRTHEHRLLATYHAALSAGGVAGYTFEDCWDDYRAALLLPACRLATAVGLHPGLAEAQGGFWDIVFPRFANALSDLGVRDLFQNRYDALGSA